MFLIKVVEKVKTHILCSLAFFGNRAVYEIMWKNSEEPERPEDNIIRRMRIACWIHKHTLRICRTYFLSTATMVARMLHYTDTACLVTNYIHKSKQRKTGQH